MASDILNSEEMSTLLTLVEEAARSTPEGVKYFVEPAEGALRRATSRRHHIVFGRRGSGKSSLLRKAAADLTVDRRPIAWIDLEPFKNHSYPDLLLSILIATFREFRLWLETAAVMPATKLSFWKKLFGKKPTRKAFDKPGCATLVGRLAAQLVELEQQLHAADAASVSTEATVLRGVERSDTVGVSAAASVPGGTLAARGERCSKSAESAKQVEHEEFRRSKVEFLQHHVLDYQSIFDEMARISDGDSYLFLDDLYHIRKSDQPRVLDYFHSVAKGHRLWLKTGTIRHRTEWYVHGNPPLGVKLGDDADDIDLDLTLEKYALAKEFLTKILANFARTAGLSDLGDFLTDGAVDRLVLASGGVARDFLSVFRRAVTVARERGDGPRGPKVGAEDINMAAGEYDSTKRDEFKRDVHSEDEASLDAVFREVRAFCLDEIETNCFLLAKDAKGATVEAIHELVDLKLLHLIRSRVTVNTRQGQLFEAYMLDLSQYAGERKRRGLNMIEFWHATSKDDLRKASFILDAEKRASTVE